MTIRHDPFDPANMTPEQRRTEVTTILASGALRLRRRMAIPSQLTDTSSLPSSESPQISLDVSAETSPHGHRG